MDNTYTLQLKAHLLDMLRWFHTLCVDNNLRYYALGGTMLGAVRHGGFIPWDDDVDVGMPRSDYERLESIVKQVKQDRYILETPRSTAKDFNYCFTKLYDANTTLVENTRYRIKRGLYIDIFPLDGMGNNLSESKKHFAKINRRFSFFLARTTGIRKGRSPLKNAAVILSQAIPDFCLNDKKLLASVERVSREKDFDQCVYGGNPYGAWRYKEIMPTAVMGIPTLYKFEDMKIYGAERPDEYLTNLYGDWRKLPPMDKRVSHHDYLEMDLHRSYLEE